jgi:hypothetical protein
LKSFAATVHVPRPIAANTPIPVTGYAQVGIGGLAKVQVWVQPKDKAWPAEDKHFAHAPWVDATILRPPAQWGGGLPDGNIPRPTHGFDHTTDQPKQWPLRFSRVHWAVLLPGLARGEYILRSRTLDEKGHAQPMPRPFRKSGHAAIEAVNVTVQ